VAGVFGTKLRSRRAAFLVRVVFVRCDSLRTPPKSQQQRLSAKSTINNNKISMVSTTIRPRRCLAPRSNVGKNKKNNNANAQSETTRARQSVCGQLASRSVEPFLLLWR
jgi:hypothetical protein